MLDELIIETKYPNIENIKDKEKLSIIKSIEETTEINFDLTENRILLLNKKDYYNHIWYFKRKEMYYYNNLSIINGKMVFPTYLYEKKSIKKMFNKVYNIKLK